MAVDVKVNFSLFGSLFFSNNHAFIHMAARLAPLSRIELLFCGITKTQKSCMKQALMEMMPFERDLILFSPYGNKLISNTALGHGAH